jgi:hypothetical protein
MWFMPELILTQARDTDVASVQTHLARLREILADGHHQRERAPARARVDHFTDGI